MKRETRCVAVVASFTLAIASATTSITSAQADESDPPPVEQQVESIAMVGGPIEFTLELPVPISVEEALELIPGSAVNDAQAEDGVLVVDSETPAPVAPRGKRKSATVVGTPGDAQVIYCDQYYPFSDTYGRFTVQRKCGGAPWYPIWSFRLAPWIWDLADSQTTEQVEWTVNDGAVKTGGIHTEPVTYTFHGTFTPALAGDVVSYYDAGSFSSNGYLYFWWAKGRLRFKGPVPPGPL